MTAAATLRFGIAGIGVLGPGLDGWLQAAPVLRTPRDWRPTPTRVPAPTRLPPTERRRAGLAVKAAVVVADQACTMAGLAADQPATVFTSASGDPAICHALCEALAQPERLVSPTRFTNSVHNAPAGYWHIAAQSQRASTSLAAYDASVHAGLLEAAAQCCSTQAPVLLVACDIPYPEPLHALRPLPDVFAFALLLVPAVQVAPWSAALSLDANGHATASGTQELETLRRAVPAARALPLLELLARGGPGQVLLQGDGLDMTLLIGADK